VKLSRRQKYNIDATNEILGGNTISERQELIESIAQNAGDYRLSEIEAMSPEHVNTWISQFSGDVQLPMLQELDYVLKQTYISKKIAIDFLEGLITTDKLAGSDPCDFWKRTHFLNIQKNGHSQTELLTLFDDILKAKCNLTTAECGAPDGDFIYLDDAIFSGNRMGNDLEDWIAKEAPAQAVIHVVAFVMHTLGRYLAEKKLKTKIKASGKKIEIKYWCARSYENRKFFKKDSEVLWPVTLPDDPDLKAYLDLPQKFPFEARQEGGKLGPFSSEQGRQLLERELLIAGVKIRTTCNNPKDILRPLGFSPFGLGFGSMVVTFRNCSNTCPLALWWGDPATYKLCHTSSSSVAETSSEPANWLAKAIKDMATTSPLRWYPLFQRKTYSDD
jgi:hypothetical protein